MKHKDLVRVLDDNKLINELISNSISNLTYDNYKDLYEEGQYGLYHGESNKLSNKIKELVNDKKLKGPNIQRNFIIVYKTDTETEFFGW